MMLPVLFCSKYSDFYSSDSVPHSCVVPCWVIVQWPAYNCLGGGCRVTVRVPRYRTDSSRRSIGHRPGRRCPLVPLDPLDTAVRDRLERLCGYPLSTPVYSLPTTESCTSMPSADMVAAAQAFQQSIPYGGIQGIQWY
jgi:hypothetical protein